MPSKSGTPLKLLMRVEREMAINHFYILVLDDLHNHSDQLVCLVSNSQVHKINNLVSKSQSAQFQPNRGETWNR
jgi:hypothetical protein